jgi:hypothetical protein
LGGGGAAERDELCAGGEDERGSDLHLGDDEHLGWRATSSP